MSELKLQQSKLKVGLYLLCLIISNANYYQKYILFCKYYCKVT